MNAGRREIGGIYPGDPEYEECMQEAITRFRKLMADRAGGYTKRERLIEEHLLDDPDEISIEPEAPSE